MTVTALPRTDLRRVAVYVRISLDKTGDQLGVKRQEHLCRELAEQRGWTVAEVYKDNDLSAYSGKRRPAYERMLTAVRRGELDTIVCVDQDRLLRRMIDLEALIDMADRLGLWVITQNGDLDLTNEDGQMRARIQTSVAQHEVAKKGKRQRRAEAQAREMGKPPRRWSFGYKPGGMEIDPEPAEAIREAYRYLLDTSGRGSLAEIARRWNDRGLVTSFGKPWGHVGVRTVLLNPRNAAIRTYGRAEIGPGTWPALVPEETFRTVAAFLADPARRKVVDSGVRKWVGSGLYRCGVCGSPVAADRASDTGRRVYRCRAAKHLTRVAEPIDALVFATVEERLARPDVADLVTVEVPEDRDLAAQANALRAHLRRLENDYGDDLIPARVWKEQSARKEAELDRIEARRAEIRKASELAPVLTAADPVAAFQALDVGAKSAFIDLLLEITLLKSPGGGRPFDPATVRLRWR